MLWAYYEGEAELNVCATKAQQDLDILVYTNKHTMTFKAMITWLNKAYIILKKHGQDYMDKFKVEQLAKHIGNPGNNIQITVAVETMREAHKANFTVAVQYITARMAQINTASVLLTEPSSESSQSLEDSSSTACNGALDLNSFHSSLASAMNTSHSAMVFLVLELFNMARVFFVIFHASRNGATKVVG